MMKASVSVLLALLLSSCAKPPMAPSASDPLSDSSDRKKSTVQHTLRSPTAGKLAVVDFEGRPVAGATIQIGDKPDLPFAGNVVTTDALGLVAVPTAWVGDQPVSIEAAGYVRATYLGRAPEAAVFQIRHSPAPQPLQLQGKTTGFGLLPSNGILDVSLVYPAISRSQAATFELTQLIGTGSDAIRVYGETLNLPSSLSIPAQSESFSILPVSLDKPTYRVSVAQAGNHRFAAVHGRFNFSQTINDLRAGKSFFDVINRIEFRSLTTRDYSITRPAQSADFPLGETPLQPAVSVAGHGIPSGYAMMATTLAESDGQCVVTDVKRLLAGETRALMSVAPSGRESALLVRTLKRYDARRIDFSGSDYEEASSVLTAANDLSPVSFLPILKSIVAQGRELILPVPSVSSAAFSARMTYVTLSKFQAVKTGDLVLVEKTPLWDFYGDDFSNKLAIPNFARELWTEKGRYRWELRYAGDSAVSSNPRNLGPENLSQMTHVTKTAIDFTVR